MPSKPIKSQSIMSAWTEAWLSLWNAPKYVKAREQHTERQRWIDSSVSKPKK